MKKTITTLMCIISVILFTACGGSGASNESSETAAPDNSQQSETNDNVVPEKTDAVGSSLAKGGLTLDAIKPDANFAKAGLFDDTVVLFLDNKEQLAPEQKEAILTKLYNAIAAASDDGKVYEGTKELDLSQTNYAPHNLVGVWNYPYKGEKVLLIIGLGGVARSYDPGSDCIYALALTF